jgi:hypothetical protein
MFWPDFQQIINFSKIRERHMIDLVYYLIIDYLYRNVLKLFSLFLFLLGLFSQTQINFDFMLIFLCLVDFFGLNLFWIKFK